MEILALEIIITVVVVVVNFLLGLLVYLNNPKSDTNRYFFAVAIIIGLWQWTNFYSLHSPNEATTLFWIRVVMVISSFLGPALFLLVKTFPKRKSTVSLRLRIPLYLLAVTTALFALTPYMFSSVTIDTTNAGGSIQPTPGPAIALFAIDYIGLFVLSFLTLVYKFRKSEGLERAQLRMLLAGIIITFTLLGITNFVFVVLLKISSFVVFGPAFSLILVGFIAYAIVRHRMLDIRLVIARTVSYSLLVLFLGLMYTGLLFGLGSFVFNLPFDGAILLYATALSLILAFSFQRVRSLFQKATDSIFYKDLYEIKDLVYQLALVMASTLELDQLTKKLLKPLVTEMRLMQGQLIVWGRGDEPQHIQNYQGKLQFEQKELSQLKQRSSVAYFDDLPESGFKNILREKHVSAVVPLIAGKDKVGCLVLGEKQSGDVYADRDISLIEIIAPQFALALQNAARFETIEQFNITLKEEVKKATENLRSANKRLKELDKLKDEFVSVTSHELRTPITAIRGYLWMAAKKSDQLPPKTKEHVMRAFHASEHLAALTNDILDVSRIEGSRFELNPERFDLKTLIDEVVDELQQKADDKKQKLKSELEKSITVEADPERIRQVLVNLIGNAIKYTPDKGSITVSIEEADGSIKVNVTDTGSGIAKDDIPKLFHKFTRLENSYIKQANIPGTGLGLFVCKKIIELSGGTLGVVSKLGQGSTFYFTLPIKTSTTS